MNIWLKAAIWLLFALIPCAITCFKGNVMDRLVAFETAGVLASLVLLMLTEGTQRIPFVDLSLTLALLAFAGGLVFARFLERWI